MDALKLRNQVGQSRRSGNKLSRSGMPRLSVERLEDRHLLSTIIGLSATNELLTFDSANPQAILNSVRITGLQNASDEVIGIDYRPATGLLYGATRTSLYTIVPLSGVATWVAGLTTAASGNEFGFDFNPVVDRLRIASDSDQNLRVNPNGGSVTVDGRLAYTDANAGQNPNIAGSAYINPDNDPATATALYGIDSRLDILVTQSPANDGSLQQVGRLGINTGSRVGFDVAGDNTAYAALTNLQGGSSGHRAGLYTINLATGAATLVGNIGGNRAIRDITVAVPEQQVFGVTNDNRLVTFNSAAPEVITSSRRLTGLVAGESIRGIDFRPATGVLFGVGSSNRIYTINTATGAVRQVNRATLNGDQFGFDFNPAADALRIASDADQNLRLATGGSGDVIVDGQLSYATGDLNAGKNPNIVGSAYFNNFPGTTETVLYGIDSTLNILVTQNPANSGSLQTVGSLGINVASSDVVGFDISSGNVAYAAIRVEGESVSKFYQINLTTGAATLLVGQGAAADTTAGNEGIIGASRGGRPSIVGIAIAPPIAKFFRPNYFAREDQGSARILVLRTGDTSGTLAINYATSNGSAAAGSDYLLKTGVLTFSSDEVFKSFSVDIVDDNAQERTETINLTLSNPPAGGRATIAAQSRALLSILDDDGRAAGEDDDDDDNEDDDDNSDD